jgi:SsrA-binding protein
MDRNASAGRWSTMATLPPVVSIPVGRHSASAGQPDGIKVVATNRSARHEFEILDTLEVGIELRGSEVKALREGTVQIADSHARVRNGQLWLVGMHIPPWQSTGAHDLPDADRTRRLLAHKSEIQRLDARTSQQRLTLVPLRLYFSSGRAKIELAVARARTKRDRRQDLAAKSATAEVRAALGSVGD